MTTIQLLEEQMGFTPQEREVAQFILQHLHVIPTLSAQEVAKQSYTSKATVVRLGQKLGFAGYQELKLQLLAEWHEKQRIKQLLAKEPISAASGVEHVTETIEQLYDKAVTNTRLALRKPQILKILGAIEQADQLLFVGTGVSYSAAELAAFKFANLGLDATAVDSLNKYYLALTKHKKIVIFLISFTGNNDSVYQMAKYLKSVGIHPVIGLVGPHHKALKDYCDEIVELPNRDSLIGLDVISSNLSLTYIIDTLFGLYLAKTYDRQVAATISLREKSQQ